MEQSEKVDLCSAKSEYPGKEPLFLYRECRFWRKYLSKVTKKMNRKRFKKALSFILCTVLIVAMALCTTGCSGSKNLENSQESITAVFTDGDVLGEGSTTFKFTVVAKAGEEASCEIHTDEKTVGAALLKLGVIEGEEGPYGLYVKKVNGITADYDVDSTYWAFYIGGEYGMTGVDVTEITAGSSYAFKVEK